MRYWSILAGLALLTGCEQSPGPTGVVRSDSAPASGKADVAISAPAASFDYRYEYRLPAARIAAVQESHAKGCDQLGSARCRITAMRYAVGSDSKVAAVLTVKIDPVLARAYGKAATSTVTNAEGVLIDSDIAGADSVAASGRGDTVIAKLRDALGNADAQLRTLTDPDARADASAKAARIRSAIAAIGEVDQVAAASVATTPVIFSYNSGGPVPGLGGSSEASFETAWQTFVQSLGGLAVILAGIAPWIVLLVGGALVLRYVLPAAEAAPEPPRVPRHDDGDPHRNVIQRWFQREPENID